MSDEKTEKLFRKALATSRKSKTDSGIAFEIGDEIQASYGDLTGKVISVGRVNVKIQTQFRASPMGPWFEQIHTVPKHLINLVMRDGKIIHDITKKAQVKGTHGYTPDYPPALIAFLDKLKWTKNGLSAPWIGQKIPLPKGMTPYQGPTGEVKLGRKRVIELLEAAGFPKRPPRPGYEMTIVMRETRDPWSLKSDPGLYLTNSAGRFTLRRG